jgi:hypothetical protein
MVAEAFAATASPVPSARRMGPPTPRRHSGCTIRNGGGVINRHLGPASEGWTVLVWIQQVSPEGLMYLNHDLASRNRLGDGTIVIVASSMTSELLPVVVKVALGAPPEALPGAACADRTRTIGA